MAATPDPITQPARSVAERLLVKVQTAWQDISECTEQVSSAFITAPGSPSKPADLDAIRGWYGETTRVLLVEPVRKFLQRQPIRQTLEVMRASDQQTASTFVRSRMRIDARFQRLLTLAALDLCEPWRIWRGGDFPTERKAWESRRRRRNNEAAVLLNQYARWVQRATLADAKHDLKPKDVKSDALWEQHRALMATLEVELSLRDLTVASFDSAEEFVIDVQREREGLLSYTATILRWLEDGARPDSTAASDSFGLIAPEERLRGWAVRMEALANRRLPEKVKLLTVDLNSRMRSTEARASFLKVFDGYGRAPMRSIAEREWHKSANALRKVEQAKEMIVYWSEASSNRPSEAQDLMAEARHNAISTLAEEAQVPIQAEPLDVSVTDAFWTWHKQGLVLLEAELYGWVTLLRQPRGRALFGTVLATGQLQARKALRRAGQWTSTQVDRTMESIGGRVPARPALPPVVRRTTLRDTLSLPATTSDLPTLYRLLFRLTPVEDRRFLVGRDEELAGLEQAVNDWVAGRFAACLLVGARGSGKTSLLNCATRNILVGEPLIRAEFHERILTPEKLDSFLCSLLNICEGTDLEAAFRAERRVLILEEAERIYLRKVGGFAAAHRLAHLIHRTASTTLWVIVMNDRSFRVLDAAAHLHRVFSHRINAMSVSRKDLENAILERHRLSGLRLEFAPPPAGDPRVNRLKRWIGLDESSAQKLFFDSLFQQSEGIFRSAFQLWLSSIERAEGETIKIRQPLDPAFSLFRSELAQQDQFTLLEIQEHGSLTQDELSEVLCEPRELSVSRMERLSELGLLESDPDHPGLRVNPEAQRFVNDLLRRSNFT